jgi:hypothetical protein
MSWLTRKPGKAGKPGVGMGKIDIGDLIKAKVSEDDFNVLCEMGRFFVLSVSEPLLSVGPGVGKILFPREFSSINRFYTGDKPLSVKLRFYYCHDDSVKYVNTFLDLLVRRAQKYKFSINKELFRNCEDLYNAVIEDLKTSNTQNVIVGAFMPAPDYEQFLLVKAHSVIYSTPSHLINMKRLRKILEEDCRDLKPHECPAYNAYALNNIVQLYAKAGGIPWVPAEPSLLQDVAVIGMATARIRDGSSYVIGVAYAVAYFGKELRSFVNAELFNLKDLDMEVVNAKGLYIPRSTASKLLSKIVEACKSKGIKVFMIFQTPVIHQEEVEALQDTFANFPWILVHVKREGFAKRIYDESTNDKGPLRGVCLIHKDYIKAFADKGFLKTVLAVTGWTESGERLYKGTPKPLELEILIQREQAKNVNPIHLATYVSRLILLLGKMDWEAYSNWPKMPFVVKYAHRIAEILARAGGDLREKVLNILHIRGAELRYIM